MKTGVPVQPPNEHAEAEMLGSYGRQASAGAVMTVPPFTVTVPAPGFVHECRA
jgi:hypothetical protein